MSMYGKNHYNIVISLQLNKFFKKLKIQKTKIMASSPIPSWQIEEEKVETVTNLTYLGSKITAGEGNGNPLLYSCLKNPMD